MFNNHEVAMIHLSATSFGIVNVSLLYLVIVKKKLFQPSNRSLISVCLYNEMLLFSFIHNPKNNNEIQLQ